MIKALIKYFKEDPKGAIADVTTAVMIFATAYFAFWFFAILNGTV